MNRVFPIYAVLFLIGMGRAFSGPASSALVPHLVPEEHFVNAVTWGGAIWQFSNITGPALGGLLFTLPLGRWLADKGMQRRRHRLHIYPLLSGVVSCAGRQPPRASGTHGASRRLAAGRPGRIQIRLEHAPSVCSSSLLA